MFTAKSVGRIVNKLHRPDAILQTPNRGEFQQPNANGQRFTDCDRDLPQANRSVFLKVLASDFGVHTANATDQEPLLDRLYRELMRTRDSSGLEFLIDLRAGLLDLSKVEHFHPKTKATAEWLRSKIQDDFSVGNMSCELVTSSSPPKVLEKIMKYEAVHPVESLDELRKRLLPGRECFSMFHKSVPHEPYAFVFVSYEKLIQTNVQNILDHPPLVKPEDAQAAIFYTITSFHKGLSGIDLANTLLKHAIGSIQRRFPNIRAFSTLSPIPGFRNWLETQLNLANNGANYSGKDDGGLLLPAEILELQGLGVGDRVLAGFKDLLDRFDEPQYSEVLKRILMRLCANYILLEKKRSFALDPVANFHIRNGACVYQLNWMGDQSAKGIAQSFGIMVNYLYDLPNLIKNNENYMNSGVIAVADANGECQWAIDVGRRKKIVQAVVIGPLISGAKL
ncbi:hypothetical protein HDU82_004520 [Entophlyctis luteolus]|nr:hypothetical protein HDU82_004520 [Entophlyctis luteolus]